MAATDGAALLREAVAVRGPVIDLAGAALACAAMDRSNLDLAPYRAHLATLARDVGAAAGRHAPAAALAQALAVAHGYAGDRESYDDLDNADLARVIDRRRGLPVALSILWMHAARAQGWRCHGLDAPGHFVIRLEAGGRGDVLDPFDGGRSLDAEALAGLLGRIAGAEGARAARALEPVDDRSVLLRLQNNIKLRLVRAGEHARALGVVERMLLIAPRAVELWRESARLHDATGALRAAIAAFETAMALAGEGDARQRIAAELASVQGRLN